ncbi:MAG TPA: AAA family ATPase [bacterium]|nr:AAA family ATPase [bacterium]
MLTEIRIDKTDTLKSAADVQKPQRPSQPQIIAVAGGKGGVGKTVVTATIGLALAEKNHQTVLLDADFFGPNLHYLFGVYASRQSLSDYFAQNCDINDMVVPTPVEHLRLLPAVSQTRRSLQPAARQKAKLIHNLSRIEADYLVIDLGPSAHFNNIDLFLNADVQLLVSTAENTSLYGAYQFLRASLFRKLQRSHPHWARFAADFMQCGDLTHGRSMKTVAEFIDETMDADLEDRFHLLADIAGLRPQLLINNLRDTDARDPLQALRLAAKEALNLELSLWGVLHHDIGVIAALRRNQPIDLLHSTAIGNQLRNIVQRKLVAQKSDRRAVDNDLPLHDWTKVRICSSRCIAWTCCCRRNGGTPCAVMHPDLACGKAASG